MAVKNKRRVRQMCSVVVGVVGTVVHHKLSIDKVEAVGAGLVVTSHHFLDCGVSGGHRHSLSFSASSGNS